MAAKILAATAMFAALIAFPSAAFSQAAATQSPNAPATPAPGTQPSQAPATPPSATPATEPPATPAAQPPATPAASAPEQPARPTAEPTTAQVLLDRIDQIVTKAIQASEPKLPNSGESGAVGTSGHVSAPGVHPSGGTVTIDRAALEEIRAEVEQLKSLMRRP